jgi:hypothetical protein
MAGNKYQPARSKAVPVTASKLRENIYRILDQVLETGVPVEIERRGRASRSSRPQYPISWTISLTERTLYGAILKTWYTLIGQAHGGMIYLDTHVLVWLYAGLTTRVPAADAGCSTRVIRPSHPWWY